MIRITKNEAGQRLDKFLLKYLNEAPSSLIHKFLRKKDIRLNAKRADGSERLQEGDEVQIRLSDASIDRLRSEKTVQGTHEHIHVLYEDADVLILDKPAGILTQKSSAGDTSLNEEMLSYLSATGSITAESLSFFRPSVCNRLDRNTSGIVLAAKTFPAAQALNALIRSRNLKKYYQCIVFGEMRKSGIIEGYLRKDASSNKVSVSVHPAEGAAQIRTRITPMQTGSGFTRLRVELITGKPHQIRAQLSAMGHPIAGDRKYGGAADGIRRQMLTAYEVVFPRTDGALKRLSEKTIRSPLPEDFRKALQKTGLE